METATPATTTTTTTTTTPAKAKAKAKATTTKARNTVMVRKVSPAVELPVTPTKPDYTNPVYWQDVNLSGPDIRAALPPEPGKSPKSDEATAYQNAIKIAKKILIGHTDRDGLWVPGKIGREAQSWCELAFSFEAIRTLGQASAGSTRATTWQKHLAEKFSVCFPGRKMTTKRASAHKTSTITGFSDDSLRNDLTEAKVALFIRIQRDNPEWLSPKMTVDTVRTNEENRHANAEKIAAAHIEIERYRATIDKVNGTLAGLARQAGDAFAAGKSLPASWNKDRDTLLATRKQAEKALKAIGM
jgi:hypothetical protein